MRPFGNTENGQGATTQRRVLLVEDSEAVRGVLKTMLEENSVAVVEARDGAEGLSHLHDDPEIGLVFLDMNMPGMGGLEMLRLIRAEPALSKIPVVVMTGEASSSVMAARSLGAVGLLQKPVRYDAIIKLAQNFLSFSRTCATS